MKNKKIQKIADFFRQERYYSFFILFIIAFSFFFFLQNSPSFADPDSFYHAKVTEIMGKQGIIKDFHWLRFTVLNDYYIDHHFLYHIFLIPFVIIMPPLAGVKFATIIFATAAILVFYWFLLKLRVKGAFWWSSALFLMDPFIFRINLAKVPSLSISILLIGVWLIISKKYKLLFGVCYFYVWLYGGWPLMAVAALVYLFSSAVYQFALARGAIIRPGFWGKVVHKLKGAGSGSFVREPLKAAGVVLAGLLAGLVINPYFPKNLVFYWHQIVEIALVNYQKVIGVGAEWYPLPFIDFIGGATLLFISIIIGLTLFLLFIKKQDEKTIAFLILTILFFFLTLKSRRNIEYFIPFALIFSSLSISKWLEIYTTRRIWRAVIDFFNRKTILAAFLATYFIFIFLFCGLKGVINADNNIKAGFSFEKYKKVSEFLRANTPRGSIIFHNDWDDFPFLFYHNPDNDYIVGLDATFMYKYDPDLYWMWAKITTSEIKNDLAAKIYYNFNSRYVLVDSEHPEFARTLAFDDDFKLIYADEEAKIFKIKDDFIYR